MGIHSYLKTLMIVIPTVLINLLKNFSSMKKLNVLNSILFIFFFSIVLQAQTPGKYHIQSAIGGKYLDVQWGHSAAGTPLHLWPFNGGVAQKFKLIPADGGYFYIKSDLGRYVHIPNSSGAAKTIVALGNYSTKNNYKWKFVSAGNGYYYIKSKTGTYLDVQWGKSDNGTPIWMWTYNGGNAQKWKLHRLGAPNTQPTRIPYGLWKTGFDVALREVKVKINNFTSRDFANTNDNTYRWVQPNDCMFEVGGGSQPFVRRFDLAPFRAEPMTIYIQNINLSRSITSYENGKLRINFHFEDRDPEVRTNCIDNFGCGGIGNPNFNFVNPGIEVLVEPIIVNGKVSYKNPVVRIHGHLSHIGVNVTVSIIQEIMNMLNFDVNNELKTRGAKYMVDFLNRNDTKTRISNILNENLSQASRYGINLPATMSDIRVAGNGDLLIYP